MSKECDVFSDSYGCIITKSIGYQAPFPLVRLSNSPSTPPHGAATVHAACFIATPADQSAARGRLLRLRLTTKDACISFLHLLDPARPPIALDAKATSVQKVTVDGTATAVLTRGERGRCSTAVYVDSDAALPRCAHVVLRRTTAAALHDGTLWLTSTRTGKSKAAEAEAPLLLHRCTIADATSGAALAALPLPLPASAAALDVVALTAQTAAVFTTAGVAVGDGRTGSAPLVIAAAIPLSNGAMAGQGVALTFDADRTLRVFDLRSAAQPLLTASTSSYVCVKASASSSRAALLVTGDVAGVLDLQTLTTTASLQHWGDTVLDAALLPERPGETCVCTSTASGMLYDWTVAM